MKIINRTQLENEFQTLLDLSGIVKMGQNFKKDKLLHPIITQSSSGSRNFPLLIPRSYNDILDIISRFLSHYQTYFNQSPKKVAMLGGISHMNATSSLQIDNLELRFVELSNLSEILTWKPEIISCYPSVLRSLILKFEKKLSFLKAIKVGGEKLFPADCENIFHLYPDLLIIEQYGSTELPALAFRSITKSNFTSWNFHINLPFELQKKRFSYFKEYAHGWHPFIAKDNFHDLLLKIDAFYDTGDEALWENGLPIDFRRKSDSENDYGLTFNNLLRLFISFQLNLNENVIYTDNQQISCNSYQIHNSEYSVVHRHELVRIRSSNKLPLLLDK